MKGESQSRSAARPKGRAANGQRPTRLSQVYLGQLPRSLAEAHAREPLLERMLENLLVNARAAWPELGPTEHEFLCHIASVVPRGMPAAAALTSIHAQDLFLACGCGRGDRKALREFDRRLHTEVPAALTRMNVGAALAEIGRAHV